MTGSAGHRPILGRVVQPSALSVFVAVVFTAGLGATAAAIRIDGVPVGNVPYSANVSPGRHMVQVGREGFVTFSQSS